jgi:two-component system chemotaxis response regulator CheY
VRREDRAREKDEEEMMERRAKRVLVVDDSATMRQLVKMMVIKYAGCEVSEAKDGQEAFEMIGAEPFDLVVTDINMPRMHGLALVEKVRKEGLDIPVIIVTTMGAEKDRELGMELGANAYVTKPVNGIKLAESIKSLLG